MDRKIAERGRYPAIDVLKSLSRLSGHLYTEETALIAKEARKLLSLYADMEELVRIGAYARGADPQVDRAVAISPEIENILTQSVNDNTPPQETFMMLAQAMGMIEQAQDPAAAAAAQAESNAAALAAQTGDRRSARPNENQRASLAKQLSGN
jgi:flagellum-specific ATP synthase